MNTASEKILLVESDPHISDLIARQALQPLGYQVQVVDDVNSAILQAAQFAPDLVVANLNLPGLSGKDLLVALNSQELPIPVIVLAEKGQENSVIQAFRLGAADYLLWPAREAEVVAAVEHGLKQVRETRARQKLDSQLQLTNQELQRRVRELTTIFAVGKAVISITDQKDLFDKLSEGMVYVAEADYGYLLLREDLGKNYLLTAHRNLPASWARKIGQPVDDGVSALVALSGEALTIHGEPIKRFKISTLGQSVLVAPVKVQNEVIGLLVVVRKADWPFDRNMQTLLEAVADYASISLVNARLFRALQEQSSAAQAGESRKREQLQGLRKEIQIQLQPVRQVLEMLLAGKMEKVTDQQQQALASMQSTLERVLQTVTADPPSRPLGEETTTGK
ncbi:MAG: response regulator [Anaerolineales bacterium]|nr:response regulator [Anaerolineales bacterium]